MSSRVQIQIAAAAVGAGLALHAVGLSRAHALLAGAEPLAPGFAAAGGLLLGWGLGARRAAAPSSRTLLAAGIVAGLTGVLAPLPLGSLSGRPAAATTLLLAAVSAFLAGRALPGRSRPSCLIAAGVAAAFAALLYLPHFGPAATALLGGILLILGAPLLRGAPAAKEEPEAAATAAGPPLAWLLLLVLAAGLASAWRPWPFGATAAGFAALTAGATALVALSARVRVALAAVAGLGALFAASGLVSFEPVALADRVAAGPALTALLLAALAFGALPGAVAGFLLPRPGALSTALGGLLIGAAAVLGAGGLAAHPLMVALALIASFAAVLVPQRGAPLKAAMFLAPLLLLLLPGGTGLDRGTTLEELGNGDARLLVQGRAAAQRDAAHRADELLAGHAAGFLASERGGALVVGLQSGGAIEALRAQGFEEIALRATCSDFAQAGLAAGLDEAPEVAAAPSAWPERPGGWDAIVLQADDPTLAAFAPAFTASARRRAASLLAPGGVLVHRLRVDRLGPEGLASLLKAAEAEFPERWLLTADLARDGVVLLVARPQERRGDGLPWDRLVLDPARNPRLDEAVARSLKEALLFKQRDLINSFAAGERELAELTAEAEPLDAWLPGASAARRWPAPEAAATNLTRAMLYARLATLELPLQLQAEPGVTPWPDSWSFAGLETRLEDDWRPAGGQLRLGNRFRPVLGDFGLYRDESRKISFERAGGRLEVSLLPRSVAGPDTVQASARSFLDEHATRTAEGAVHGHRALIVVREPSEEEQRIHMTWHCPVQGRLYAAEYRVDDGKPGLFEQPLEELGRSIRCAHPPPPGRR